MIARDARREGMARRTRVRPRSRTGLEPMLGENGTASGWPPGA
jgi:hypothetical protein